MPETICCCSALSATLDGERIRDIDKSTPAQEIAARRWSQSESSCRLKSPWSAPWLDALRVKAMAAQAESSRKMTIREFRRRLPIHQTHHAITTLAALTSHMLPKCVWNKTVGSSAGVISVM